jgi:hypothetical protein
LRFLFLVFLPLLVLAGLGIHARYELAYALERTNRALDIAQEIGRQRDEALRMVDQYEIAEQENVESIKKWRAMAEEERMTIETLRRLGADCQEKRL